MLRMVLWAARGAACRRSHRETHDTHPIKCTAVLRNIRVLHFSVDDYSLRCRRSWHTCIETGASQQHGQYITPSLVASYSGSAQSGRTWLESPLVCSIGGCSRIWCSNTCSCVDVGIYDDVARLIQSTGANASAGNRARVTSMATMYSTTRPLMLLNNF